ncbi:MAG: sugar ABC transporter permease [Sinomonas sp.]|nr:sugar ABC transporter permease [Sinomonas sp.]
MNAITSSIPGLIIIGAIVIPAIIYASLGLGERLFAGFGAKRNSIRPWLWLLAPLFLVALVLLYPLAESVVLSFFDQTGKNWAGGGNFAWAFSNEMTSVLGNNLIWLVALPVGTVFLALLAAVLFDRVRYEKLAMTLIILPTAISFTAGSVIWRDTFSYQPGGATQTGLLNALWTAIPGNQPVPWLQAPFVNTLCLIFVAIWASLGIAALILSASVKSVPAELIEAARLDGAGEWRIFLSVTLVHIAPALLVVVTTSVIFSLKVFDIVYVMTNGNFNTDTIANREYYELFSANNLGHASVVAIILLVAALPIVAINIRQFRKERSA